MKTTALEDLLSRLPRWRRSDIAAGPRGLDSDFDQLRAAAAAELADLKAATTERECVAGNLVFRDVEVRLKQ